MVEPPETLDAYSMQNPTDMKASERIPSSSLLTHIETYHNRHKSLDLSGLCSDNLFSATTGPGQ